MFRFFRPKGDEDMARTLVVVDMQSEFASTAEKCTKQVVREVKRAKRRGAGVIVLEYKDAGKTFKEIRDELKGYGRKTFATKNMNDGSHEAMKAAKRNGFSTEKIRVCGVNRSYCVLGTVEGFRRKGVEDIETAIDATWCHDPTSGKWALKRVTRFVK